MEYTLYKLKFSTGLHIGMDTGGSSLDDGRMTIHVDTLFSALCCECVKNGEINRLYEYFACNKLVISDALPFFDEEIYLPKPIIHIDNRKHEGDSGLKKRFKSIEYIPLSAFSDYINGLTGSEIDPERLEYDFGNVVVDTRVTLKDHPQPMPYNIAYWRFNNNSGLYVIVGYEDESAISFFESALSSLGLSGVGGKQSSGLGKFSIQKVLPPQQLTSLLMESDSDYQMMLGTALPCDEDLDYALDGGWYTMIRRGGFVRSDTYSQSYSKKRTLYTLSPGSCLKDRFDGAMFDLSEGGKHPVWRCCKTLFVGVSI